ncbi:phosphocholine cytidylyltransferase family protein [Omnitrophica bacterium]|nr:phosphocholine cytidylyltransferase family protein [Candidatus Omnitrophota bacterium]
MNIVILAAGKGERLMPLTKNTPKTLLEVGNGDTILENQLLNIRECGIRDIALVVGYKGEQIEAKVKDLKKDINISMVYNPFYDITNNLVSLWMAKEELREDFIILNGDVIFKQNVMKNLLEADGDVCMVIDRKETYVQEDMKVIIERNLVHKVSKKISLQRANGESIGMHKFQDKGRKRFVSVLEMMVREKENLGLFYLAAIQRMIDDGMPVRYSECKPDDWLEVDFHPDLKNAKMNIKQFTKALKEW